MKNDEREQLLKDAIIKAEAEGIKVRPGGFGNRWRGLACSIGCLILNEPENSAPAEPRIAKAAQLLDIDTSDIWVIAFGFDDLLLHGKVADDYGSHPLYQVGRRVGEWFRQRVQERAQRAMT